MSTAELPATDASPLPSLYADRSFWGMTVTQFFGAFNDNLFKQLVLLLSISTAVQGSEKEFDDQQWLPMLVFAAPFLIFTGIAGYFSDKLGKRGIIVSCKVAEVIVMGLGAIGFSLYSNNQSLLFLYSVLFLMGAQSAFFGPAKYGILPEMLRGQDLPRANGFIMMTTFLAIIFGTVAAGFLLKEFRDQLWVGSVLCISIAVIGTLTSLFVRRVPAANPRLQCERSSFLVPPDMVQLLRSDRPLLMALVVSSIFWLLAGMVPSTVNILGKSELALDDDWTSMMTGMVGVGIAVGCAVGGLISRGKINFGLIRVGSVGMLLCMLLLAVPAAGDIQLLHDAQGKLVRLPGLAESGQWLGFFGSLAALLLLGVFTGFFAVPLQVFLQSRPPEDKKGRMIAVMNQANWIGVLLSAVIYFVLSKLIEQQDWPRSVMFLFIASLMLPIALFYHPKSETLGQHATVQ